MIWFVVDVVQQYYYYGIIHFVVPWALSIVAEQILIGCRVVPVVRG